MYATFLSAKIDIEGMKAIGQIKEPIKQLLVDTTGYRGDESHYIQDNAFVPRPRGEGIIRFLMYLAQLIICTVLV